MLGEALPAASGLVEYLDPGASVPLWFLGARFVIMNTFGASGAAREAQNAPGDRNEAAGAYGRAERPERCLRISRITERVALRDELRWPDTSAGTTPTRPFRFK
jgi:hypothetical protein